MSANAELVPGHLQFAAVPNPHLKARATCEALDERRVMRACYSLRRGAPGELRSPGRRVVSSTPARREVKGGPSVNHSFQHRNLSNEP